MKVPSVIVPNDFNYLLNPLHPKASQVKLVNQQPFSFDERLGLTLPSPKERV